MTEEKSNKADKTNPLVPVLVVLLVGSAFAIGYLWNKANNNPEVVANPTSVPTTFTPSPTTAAPTPAAVAEITDDEHIRGNKDAKVAIIEYSDYDCPFCSQFHETAKEALEEYGDQLMWVYRHFPLSSLHPEAQEKSEASECITELGGNDAFWQFSDKMYEDSVKASELGSVAAEIGVDQVEFNTCVDEGRYTQKVNTQFAEGRAAGVTGTPGNFIYDVESGEATLVPGAVPLSSLSTYIDSYLNN